MAEVDAQWADVDGGGQSTWTYLAVHDGRMWTNVDGNVGRGGRRWTANVDLYGRPRWTDVGTLGLDGRPRRKHVDAQ